jgi:hypothetical protein
VIVDTGSVFSVLPPSGAVVVGAPVVGTAALVGVAESPSFEHAAATSDTTTPIATTAARPFVPLVLMLFLPMDDAADSRSPASR